MAQDIRAMLEAKRGLLLAVSHKLVTGGEAREALLRDLGAMRDLIGDLLESERLAADHAALQRERCSLNALAREVVDGAFAGAALQLQLQLDPTLPDAMLDPARIRLLLRDLIDNALRHGGPDAAPPCVTTSAAGGRLRLVVRDRADQRDGQGDGAHRGPVAAPVDRFGHGGRLDGSPHCVTHRASGRTG